MYFLPRNNKLYAFLVIVKPWHRYFFTVSFLAIFIVCWYFFLYATVLQRCNKYSRDAVQLKEKLYLLGQSRRSCKDLENSVQELQQSLQLFRHGMYGEQSLQEIMFFIMQQASKNNLFLTSCSEEEEVDKQWYIKRIVQINFSGKLGHIVSFFMDIEKQVPMLVPEYVSVTHSDNKFFNVRSSLAYVVIK